MTKQTVALMLGLLLGYTGVRWITHATYLVIIVGLIYALKG